MRSPAGPTDPRIRWMSEPQQQEAPFRFFVYIVESPSAPDLYHGRSEGARLAETLKLDGISCVTRTAINPLAFVAAIRLGLPEAMKTFTDHYPVIHLSAHGGEHGVQLSSGDFISWHRLRDLLTPLNQSLNGALLLCMSSCQGYSAVQMAMQEGDAPHPYLAVIGNWGTPTWSDTAVAYLAFYHLLAKGRKVPESVEAMRAASGNNDWGVETADNSKKGYLEYLKNSPTPAAVQEQLEQVAEQQDVSADAKALEKS